MLAACDFRRDSYRVIPRASCTEFTLVKNGKSYLATLQCPAAFDWRR